jgi:WbqC-like protein family
MKTVSISQPMYFPWPGFMNMLTLSNEFVFLENVNWSRGFINRIQMHTSNGPKWMTVPLVKASQNVKIHDTYIDYTTDWRDQHLSLFELHYKSSEFYPDAMNLLESLLMKKCETISQLSKSSIINLYEYLMPSGGLIFRNDVDFASTKKKSDLILDIASYFSPCVYISGHGGRNYLDVGSFINQQIRPALIHYSISEYPQFDDSFDPYVSTLDLIAHCGKSSINRLNSTLDFMDSIHPDTAKE